MSPGSFLFPSPECVEGTANRISPHAAGLCERQQVTFCLLVDVELRTECHRKCATAPRLRPHPWVFTPGAENVCPHKDGHTHAHGSVADGPRQETTREVLNVKILKRHEIQKTLELERTFVSAAHPRLTGNPAAPTCRHQARAETTRQRRSLRL